MVKFSVFFLAPVLFLLSCGTSDNESRKSVNVAANQEVARYMQSFEARGDLADTSKPMAPEQALQSFVLPPNLSIELLLAEPEVSQPLEITFDHKGRLWVVQYSQYPYPKGLKVTGIDHHLRAQYDKVPAPPPEAVQGADKITFFEDTDGDGVYDTSTDAITGLNIATAVEFGRGHIWVLNPPSLLAYPDTDDNGLPDGPPVVHLKGFGLEDTHAVANSLRWGPDGWLYGATGSTVTSNISSKNTANVAFQGQGIWRYHPEKEEFELFSEGGGNTFHVEIDSKGRIYSGDNGAQTRGQYYKQGAYYVKNWGKHGPLTNAYAFGFLRNMPLQGDQVRFTHAWIQYEGGSLEGFNQKLIAINPLQNFLQLSELIVDGSTFRTVDIDRLVETDDHWFRPVDIKAGPDGAIYLADWYDSRLSHIDPQDNWHKSSGRIYRLYQNHQKPLPAFDISSYSSQELIGLLSHENKWFRQQALRQFGDRKDPKVAVPLARILKSETGQLALESLWALNLSGHFDDQIAKLALSHANPYVRMWAVRLLGDTRLIPDQVFQAVERMLSVEQHPEVLSQLACTAKRLPGPQAVSIIQGLLNKPGMETDPDNPLLTWWAIESAMSKSQQSIVELYKNSKLWDTPLSQQIILPRIAQKLMMLGTGVSLTACGQLLSLAPDVDLAKPVIEGIQEGIATTDLQTLPRELTTEMNKYLKAVGQAPLALQLRERNQTAINSALEVIANPLAAVGDRVTYIKIIGEASIEEAIPVLLKLVADTNVKTSIRKTAIEALGRFQDPAIGAKVASLYPDKLRAEPALRVAAFDLFSSRKTWAEPFLRMISETRQVQPSDVPDPVIRQFQLLDQQEINVLIDTIWPDLPVDNQLKLETAKRIQQAVTSQTPNLTNGRMLYLRQCGSCHKLNQEGGIIGPDLTGYDRSNLQYLITNIIDPNVDIREGYVNYQVITADGRNIVGTIADRSSELLLIKSFGGTEFRIPSQQVKQLKAQNISIMPEKLLDNLSVKELCDLFGYLMQNEFEPVN